MPATVKERPAAREPTEENAVHLERCRAARALAQSARPPQQGSRHPTSSVAMGQRELSQEPPCTQHTKSAETAEEKPLKACLG